jgi:hypothetical protein
MTENSVVQTFRQRSVVVVEEFLAVEGHQTLENTVANTTSTNGANDLALEIEGIASNVRDHPVSTLDHLRMVSINRGKHTPVGHHTSCAGTKFLTRRRIDITTCSATETTLDPETSRT